MRRKLLIQLNILTKFYEPLDFSFTLGIGCCSHVPYVEFPRIPFITRLLYFCALPSQRDCIMLAFTQMRSHKCFVFWCHEPITPSSRLPLVFRFWYLFLWNTLGQTISDVTYDLANMFLFEEVMVGWKLQIVTRVFIWNFVFWMNPSHL